MIRKKFDWLKINKISKKLFCLWIYWIYNHRWEPTANIHHFILFRDTRSLLQMWFLCRVRQWQWRIDPIDKSHQILLNREFAKPSKVCGNKWFLCKPRQWQWQIDPVDRSHQIYFTNNLPNHKMFVAISDFCAYWSNDNEKLNKSQQILLYKEPSKSWKFVAISDFCRDWSNDNDKLIS